VANTAVLRRRHVVKILDQFGAGIARQRQEASYMAAFTAVADGKVNIIPKMCRRRKITRIGGGGVVAHNAVIKGRNMVGFLAYGPDRNIFRVAAVAGLTIGVDTVVVKVGCILECHIYVRIIVALKTVVIR